MHLALAKHMHMDVINRLAAEVVAVHDDAESLLAALFFSEALSSEENMAGECLVLAFAQVMERRDVFLGNNQKMDRCMRRNVIEGDYLIVFV